MSEDTINVQMPDGTIVTDVPAGTTQGEVLRRYAPLMTAAQPSYKQETARQQFEANQPVPTAATGLQNLGEGIANAGKGIASGLMNMVAGPHTAQGSSQMPIASDVIGMLSSIINPVKNYASGVAQQYQNSQLPETQRRFAGPNADTAAYAGGQGLLQTVPIAAGAADMARTGTNAILSQMDPTALKASANALREVAAKTPLGTSLKLTQPLTALSTINRATMPARAAVYEALAKAADAQHPAVQGNMTLGPESYAATPEPPPVQGPSLPPPKAPPEPGPVNVPPPPQPRPGVMDEVLGQQKPVVDAATAVNKALGVKPSEVMRGQNPGQQIVTEKLIGKDVPTTKTNIDAALADAGQQLQSVLQQAGDSGIRQNLADIVKNAQGATKYLPKDATFADNLKALKEDIASDAEDLKSATPLEAQAIRSKLGRSIDWSATNTDSLNAIKKMIYSDIGDTLRAAVPEAKGTLERWGNLFIASKAATRAIAKGKVGLGKPLPGQ